MFPLMFVPHFTVIKTESSIRTKINSFRVVVWFVENPPSIHKLKENNMNINVNYWHIDCDWNIYLKHTYLPTGRLRFFDCRIWEKKIIARLFSMFRNFWKITKEIKGKKINNFPVINISSQIFRATFYRFFQQFFFSWFRPLSSRLFINII